MSRKWVMIEADESGGFIITNIDKKYSRAHYPDLCAVVYTMLTGKESECTPQSRDGDKITWSMAVDCAQNLHA